MDVKKYLKLDGSAKKLFKAVTAGKLADVSKYASKKDVSNDAKSKILFAAVDKPKEIMQALLDAGASANANGIDFLAIDPRQITAPPDGSILHASVRRGRQDLVQLLIGVGSLVTCKDTNGLSPLHVAAQNGYKDIALQLIRAGADLNALSNENWTPLHSAASSGSSELVRLLLENGADPLRKSTIGLVPAAVTSSSVVRNLLPSLTDTNAKEAVSPTSPLKLPTDALKSSATVPASSSKPLSSPRSPKPPSPSHSPGRTPSTPKLNQPGALEKQSELPVSSLWVAASNGQLQAVSDCLASGNVDVNSVHLDGSSPLWIACSRGHLDVVTLLCQQKGIDIESVHRKLGTTPLFAACASGSTKIVKLLLEKGAQIHTEDKQGDTLLHVASMNGNVEIVQSLLSNSSFVLSVAINEQNDDGATSLYVAAANGHVDVVQALLGAAASADIKNFMGLTPIDVSIKNNHTAVWRVLSAHLKELITKEKAEMESDQKVLDDLAARAQPVQSAEKVTVNIKAMYNNKIRSTSILNTIPIDELAASLKALFDLSPTKNVELQYTDADKDKLTIDDQMDLQDFFLFCPTRTIEIR